MKLPINPVKFNKDPRPPLTTKGQTEKDNFNRTFGVAKTNKNPTPPFTAKGQAERDNFDRTFGIKNEAYQNAVQRRLQKAGKK